MSAVAELPTGSESRLARGLVALGAALFCVSVVLPAMRWTANAAHSSAGSARVFLGDGWTLADAGFGGTALLPLAVLAGVALAVVALVAGTRPWRTLVVLAAAATYYPLWVAYAFARKLEDDVDPAIGVGVLAAGFAAVAAGLWIGRPLSFRR